MHTEAHGPRTVRVAVVDSGVHAAHPHVGGVSGGVGFGAAGDASDDWVDRIGHGTAVTAAIREKAPDAAIYAVRIFGDRLAAPMPTLLRGMDWAVESAAHLINLSLGTANPAHRDAFQGVIDRARQAGALIVAARDDEGVQWLPGSLPGVVPVQVDWTCPRGECRVVRVDGMHVVRASGFARPIPGVDPRRNLTGISFAVANVTGLLASALASAHLASAAEAVDLLASNEKRLAGAYSHQPL